VGSGFYSDPFSDPRTFVFTAPRRMITLIADAWFSLDNDTLSSTTPTWALAAFAVVVVAIVFVPMRRLFADLAEAERRAATWLLLGSVLSLAPVLAVVPSPRLLGASLLGVAPLVALLLDRAWYPLAIAPRRGHAELTGLVALALGFSHLVHAPVTTWLFARKFQSSAVEFREHVADLSARIPDPQHTELVITQGLANAFFLPFALDYQGELPARWRILAEMGHALVQRRGPRTLEIVVPVGHALVAPGPGNLLRNNELPMVAGDTFDVPGVHVTVLEAGKEGPRAARYEFDRDLEDPSLVWITEKNGAFPATPPPKIGFGVTLDP
jgi:hypothetical protein